MNHNALTRTIAGALLTGVSLLSGNAALITVGGGIGVNWASDGLGALWDDLRPPHAGSPLAAAYARALRRALHDLEDDYRRTRNPQSDGLAFALLVESADAIAQGNIALPVEAGIEGAQQTLTSSLPKLLLGHDEREVDWLQSRLLPTTTSAFRDELAQNAAARQQFSLLLIEQTARHSHTLGAAAAQLPALFDALATASVQLETIQRSQVALEQALSTLRVAEDAARPGRLYIGTGHAEGRESHAHVENVGTLPTITLPAGSERTYIVSSHAEGEKSKATVINRSVSIPLKGTRFSILALFANPTPRVEPLDLSGEVRALRESIAQYDDSIGLEIIEDVTVDDLCRGLRDKHPQLLYLVGRSSSHGFMLCDQRGNEHQVRWDDFADEFAAHVPPLRAILVVGFHNPADVARLRVPHIVLLHGSLTDEVNKTFTDGFYERLVTAVDDIQSAYEAGLRRVRLKLHSDDTELPVLHISQV